MRQRKLTAGVIRLFVFKANGNWHVAGPVPLSGIAQTRDDAIAELAKGLRLVVDGSGGDPATVQLTAQPLRRRLDERMFSLRDWVTRKPKNERAHVEVWPIQAVLDGECPAPSESPHHR